MSVINLLNVFQYWGQGFNEMPSFLKKIYKHNLEFCKKNNLNLILIDDNSVYNYITPHLRFKKLAYNFKSDIIRYYILHKYGGFWFDTDIIIIKDLNNLYDSISGYECMLDVEYGIKIGCCSLYIKKQSSVSKFCIDYINNILDKNKPLNWDDIGPNTVSVLYKKHESLILLNNYETVINGCNFICWNEYPGINKKNWYLETENLSKSKADFLKNNSSCYYLITWTIYRINDMKDNLNNIVFVDKKSVFSYFVNYEKEKIIVKNLQNSEWNGEYIEGNLQWKDKGTTSYVKDNKHHIYKHNNLWKLAESGVKVYKELGNEIGSVIDFSNNDINICFCSDENLISFIPVVINSIQTKNSENKINIHYIHSNISKNKLDIFKNYVSTFTNLELYLYHKTWDYKYSELSHITNATMLRLYIPELLNNVSKVIYLDIDIIVNINLKKLYEIDTGKTGICIKNCIGESWKKSKINTISGDCGVMIMSLDKLRQNLFTQKCIDIFLSYQPQMLHDQDIINIYLEGVHNELMPEYNIFLNQDDYLIEKNSDYILHYVEQKKPYFDNVGKYQYLWDIHNHFKTKKYAVMWASTVNIGDDIQTLAAINFLKKKGITEYSFIDREKLSDYDGEHVTLIMNGWYMHNINKFPPCDKITPVFISVHINNEFLIRNNINYFKKYEPIGCCDEATVKLFKKYSIDAYFTGCLTLLFDDVKEKTGGKYLVDVNTKCNYIPNIEFDTLKYNDFQIIEHDINSNINIIDRLTMSEDLLNKYRKAEKVITTRLHCILPCRAFNTDAVFIHKKYNNDPRFSGLKTIINGDSINHNKTNGDRAEIDKIRNKFLLLNL